MHFVFYEIMQDSKVIFQYQIYNFQNVFFVYVLDHTEI